MNSSGHRPADSLSPSLDSREHPANPPCRRQTNRSRLNQQTRPAPRRLVCLSGASLGLVSLPSVAPTDPLPCTASDGEMLAESEHTTDSLAATETSLEQAVIDPLRPPQAPHSPQRLPAREPLCDMEYVFFPTLVLSISTLRGGSWLTSLRKTECDDER